VIRTPYLDRLNYATMDLARDIGLIKNRYLNACHHLDSQLARVFAHLEERACSTPRSSSVTGDHGEEFMEKGRWGHASAFSEEQTRVPLVLYVPGEPPARIDRITSHLDSAATISACSASPTRPPTTRSATTCCTGPRARPRW